MSVFRPSGLIKLSVREMDGRTERQTNQAWTDKKTDRQMEG